MDVLTVRLLVSDYSQLPDYTFRLKLNRIIIEKTQAANAPIRFEHIYCWTKICRKVCKCLSYSIYSHKASGFAILSRCRTLSPLHWNTNPKIRGPIHSRVPRFNPCAMLVTVQWTSFFKINIYALISGLIIKQCLYHLSYH